MSKGIVVLAVCEPFLLCGFGAVDIQLPKGEVHLIRHRVHILLAELLKGFADVTRAIGQACREGGHLVNADAVHRLAVA